MKKTYLCP